LTHIQDNYQTRAVTRAFDILGAFTPGEPDLSLAAMAAKVSLPKATALRLLVCLTQAGFVEQDVASGRYRLGLRAFEIGAGYLAGLEVDGVARPYLEQMANEFNETSTLGVRDGTDVVYIAMVRGESELGLQTRIGARRPVYCTAMGKALIAQMSKAELEALFAGYRFVRYTERTIGSLTALRRELTIVHQRGWAEDDQERLIGLRTVAAPIRDFSGNVVAAISMSTHAHSVTTKRFDRLVSGVVAAAGDISTRMGARVAEAMSGRTGGQTIRALSSA
jgi:IclR family acetate operon transcriptional repressor